MLLLMACTGNGVGDSGPAPLVSPLTEDQIASFDVLRVKEVVDELGSDAYAGRTPGSLGHAQAVTWLEQRMEEVGLEPVGDQGFRQHFELSLTGRYAPDEQGDIVEIEVDQGINLAGLISGVERPEELIVVMAHHDHLGTTREGEVYNGAYDDLTGVAMLLEIARLVRDEGVQPERSILFLITDGEEGGLKGAEAWVEQAPWDLSQVIAALSVDPMGRPMLPDAWPLVLLGMERSPELKSLFRDMGRSWSAPPVHFVNRSAIPIFASDQDPFWEAPQPIAAGWVTSPGFTWYHTIDDEPETIDYRTVQDHGRFLAQALVYMADSEERWTDAGEQELTLEDAQDAIDLMDTVLGSSVISDGERAKAGGLQRDFERLAAEGSIDDAEARPIVAEAMLFIMNDLAQAHPGPVPAPMPRPQR